MAQVIIYTNTNGNVSVCIPTGELPIEQVLTKDCPAGAVIVDDSTLPSGPDAQFFDAWVLTNGVVSVSIAKAQTVATNNLNAMAKTEAQHRMTNTASGITNKLADADWLALLTTARTAITAATTTQNLLDAVAPVQTAIQGNV
jgi:hypothetical protein